MRLVEDWRGMNPQVSQIPQVSYNTAAKQVWCLWVQVQVRIFRPAGDPCPILGGINTESVVHSPLYGADNDTPLYNFFCLLSFGVS